MAKAKVEPKETWKQLSDRKYQRLNAEGEWVTIDVPYGKIEMLLSEFLGKNGIIDPATGIVKTDLMTLISNFGTIGDIMLTEFDEQGKVKVPGNVKNLSMTEVPALFTMAVHIIETFINAVSSMQGAGMTAAENE